MARRFVGGRRVTRKDVDEGADDEYAISAVGPSVPIASCPVRVNNNLCQTHGWNMSEAWALENK